MRRVIILLIFYLSVSLFGCANKSLVKAEVKVRDYLELAERQNWLIAVRARDNYELSAADYQSKADHVTFEVQDGFLKMSISRNGVPEREALYPLRALSVVHVDMNEPRIAEFVFQ